MREAMSTDARAVLDFWFGDDDARHDAWFRKDAAFDGTIRARFGPLIDAALADGLAHWDGLPHGDGLPQGTLARIVVLDQFPRNAFRDTPRSFAGDALALAAAQGLVASGADRALKPLQRWFVYLPFEHSEDRAMQAESMRLFGALAAEHPELADALEWARKHQLIVDRFGHFPHRNAILGRASTAQEEAFLKEPGSRF